MIKKICVLMSARSSQLFNHSGQDLPRWFSFPLEEVCEVYFIEKMSQIPKVKGKKGFLIFNVSWRELLVVIFLHKFYPVCSLFQWIPMEHLSCFKRICYEIILKRSEVIVTYSQIAYDYIKKLYPEKKVYFLRLWADTEYFRPLDSKAQGDRFLLCPGSHRRDEEMVCRLAKSLGIKIVRFSQDQSAIDYYRTNPHELVDFRYNVSYAEMRQLYNDAAVVVNIVDDSQIPAGLTCFVEALAMDCTVITPSGHSSAGYVFPDGEKPYYSVSLSAGFDEWKKAIEIALNEPIKEGRARDYVKKYAGIDAARSLWGEVLENMGFRIEENGSFC